MWRVILFSYDSRHCLAILARPCALNLARCSATILPHRIKGKKYDYIMTYLEFINNQTEVYSIFSKITEELME